MSLHERTLEGIEKKANADLLFTSPMDGINWACSAQTDMLILVDEIRSLRKAVRQAGHDGWERGMADAKLQALGIRPVVRNPYLED